MPLTRAAKRNREQLRREADQEEQQRITKKKLDASLGKIDELGQQCLRQMDNQMQRILTSTRPQLLRMKLKDFLNLNLVHFNDFYYFSSAPRKARTQAIAGRSARMRTHSMSQLLRPKKIKKEGAEIKKEVEIKQEGLEIKKEAEIKTEAMEINTEGVEIKTEGVEIKKEKCELPATSFLRYPNPGEVALSEAGSRLAVQALPDRNPNRKPLKTSEMAQEVLNQLRVKTLNKIREVAIKMGRM